MICGNNMEIKQKRTGLTEEKILTKRKYFALLKLIYHFHDKEKDIGLRQIHLEYILVKGGKEKYKNLNFEEVFKTEFEKALIFGIEKDIGLGKITKKKGKMAIEYWNKKFILKTMYILNQIPPNKPMFNTIYALRKALRTLSNFGIIESIQPTKGYSFWSITKKGILLYLKYLLKLKIDIIEDPMLLIKINQILNEHNGIMS